MQLVPFDSAKLPSTVVSGRKKTNKLIGDHGGTGFPVISIKGKVFHIVRGGERTLITKPGEDDPASSLEGIIVNVNEHNSKVFYANGYVEGENAKPTCYSNNGTGPETDSAEPQAKSCATCPHNQWGSRMSNEGKKLKACSDSRRVAFATPDTPNDPMLVRVPAASLKSLVEYGKILAARGVDPDQVITRIGFDYTVAHPALTFKPVSIIADQETLAAVREAADSEVVAQIIGTKVANNESGDGAEETKAEATPTPAPVAAAPAKAAPAPAKPAPAPAAVAAAVATAATTTKVAVAVEPEAAAAPTPKSPSVANLESEIGNMLDGMDFDD